MSGPLPPRDADPRQVVLSAEMLATDGPSGRIEFERGMRLAAPVTLALIAACCAAFVWQLEAGVLDDGAALVRGGALVRESLLRGELWRLFSSMFLHGGLGHLLGNMVPLFILGAACEHAFGGGRAAAIYLAAGLAGGVATAACDPRPTVGASGAVFGLMGCLVALLQRFRGRVQLRDGRIGAVVGLWALWQIVQGFATPWIANFAHIGGFVAGGLLGLVVPPRLPLRAAGTWPVVGWLVWSLTTAALAAGPVAIDGPRPPGHVIDTVGLLAADDVAAIERLAAGIEAASGGDLVVVVIDSTGGRPHRAVATDLFNRWQLGSAERDDGLLILVATADRKAEIVLGDGVDDPRQERASRRIMQEVLIPEFKAGRPAAGLRKAALACGTEILSAGPEAALPDRPLEPASGPLVPLPAEAVEPVPAEPFMPDPIEAAAPVPAWRPPPPRRESVGVLPLAVFGGGTVGGTGLLWYLVRRRARNRPRQCPECRIDMVRLCERTDDAHLVTGQQTEERLRSVDYDVWTCPTCPHVTTLRYGAFFTRHSKCPACGYATESTTVNRVRTPTTWQSGFETITEHCLHCGRSDTTSRVIPRLRDDGDSSFFSLSSGGSSFSSSSGGGSSSGSGASGSW